MLQLSTQLVDVNATLTFWFWVCLTLIRV